MTADPANTTVLRVSYLVLNCSTDANPDAHVYHYYFNGNLIGNSSSGVFNTTVMADGVYTCVPENTVGTQSNTTISITAVGKLYICVHLQYRSELNEHRTRVLNKPLTR